MRWAVAMRTRRPSHKAFKKAFDSGQIIRLHLMRGTWQLVSAEDYWMMLGLCAPKAIAVTKGWMSSNKITIPDDELYRVRDILAQTAADLGSATKEDFVQALAEKEIRMDDHRLPKRQVPADSSLRRIPHQLQVPRHRAPSRTPASCPQQQRYFPTHYRLRRHYLRQLVALQGRLPGDVLCRAKRQSRVPRRCTQPEDYH